MRHLSHGRRAAGPDAVDHSVSQRRLRLGWSLPEIITRLTHLYS